MFLFLLAEPIFVSIPPSEDLYRDVCRVSDRSPYVAKFQTDQQPMSATDTTSYMDLVELQ